MSGLHMIAVDKRPALVFMLSCLPLSHAFVKCLWSVSLLVLIELHSFTLFLIVQLIMQRGNQTLLPILPLSSTVPPRGISASPTSSVEEDSPSPSPPPPPLPSSSFVSHFHSTGSIVTTDFSPPHPPPSLGIEAHSHSPPSSSPTTSSLLEVSSSHNECIILLQYYIHLLIHFVDVYMQFMSVCACMQLRSSYHLCRRENGRKNLFTNLGLSFPSPSLLSLPFPP